MTLQPAARIESFPAPVHRSAEHARALAAAERLGLRLAKKVAQRPLMSVWDGVREDGKHVALKIVDTGATDSERARILAAASLVRRIDAPGVIKIHDVDEEAQAYVADLWAGGTAADLFLLRWSLIRLVQFIGRVCDALEAVHAVGHVHGSLAPENVLLDHDFAPVLYEVGMVSISESLAGDRDNFFGYGAYASPEAQEGKTVDPRSDVFSAGRLLAYLALEREPDDTSAEQLGTKSVGLASVFRKATAAKPDDRHASVAELRADLESLRGELGRVQPAGLVASTPQSAPLPRRDRMQAPPLELERDRDKRQVVAPRARPGLAIAGLATVVCALAAAWIVPLASSVLVVTMLVAAGAMATTFAFQNRKLRFGFMAIALVVVVVVQPVQLFALSGARQQLHRASPAGQAALSALLKNGEMEFNGANLSGANLSGLELQMAEFTGANLTGANLAKANLALATLDNADLTRALLFDANLAGIDLSSVRGITSAKCNAGTLFFGGWSCVGESPVRPGGTPPGEPQPDP